MSASVTCAAALACRAHDSSPARPRPELAVVGESARFKVGDELPPVTPWFDGKHVTLIAARGETLGIQVWHATPGAVTLTIDGARVDGYVTERAHVARPSTAMYGGSHGAGDYPDGLVAATAPASDPAYFTIAATGEPGTHTGEMVIGARRVPVQLEISRVALPRIPMRVWAYYDPRELVWAHLGSGTVAAPSEAERACIAMFRDHGVLLSPDMPASAWPARRALLDGSPYVPAVIADDPAKAGDDVRAWVAATAGTGQVPFAIPIDEPHTAKDRAKVRALADVVRASGGGERFLFAVTDEPHDEYGSAIDLYVSLVAKRNESVRRWTYNGAPPRAGSMVVDAEAPGARTWGAIGARWSIETWYVWDALYWHDRHNRHGAELPGRALDLSNDAVSFDDGDDHGDLDGVLALPGDATTPCRPTLRLEAVRRGVEDRQLFELAARCNAGAAADVLARLVPQALGDAKAGARASWAEDDAAWEAARRELLALAARCPDALQ